jgi:hypothetical protein
MKRDILTVGAIVLVLLTILVTMALRSQSDRAEDYQKQIKTIEQTIDKKGIE